MPNEPAVVVLAVRLEDAAGTVLQRNFTTFVVEGEAPAERTLADGTRVRVAHVPATAVRDARWSLKQWTVLGDRKLNGAGSGYFEYRIPWPAGLARARRRGRDVPRRGVGEAAQREGPRHDRNRRTTTTCAAAGSTIPSRNPNSYPMTGATPFPSAVTVRVNGLLAGRWELRDDPADSRGILSWHAQPRDGHLHEAGSYGQLLRVPIPADAIAQAARTGEVVVRLEVDDALPGRARDLRCEVRSVSAGSDRRVRAPLTFKIFKGSELLNFRRATR